MSGIELYRVGFDLVFVGLVNAAGCPSLEAASLLPSLVEARASYKPQPIYGQLRTNLLNAQCQRDQIVTAAPAL
jgi:hypothetical protein